MNKIYNGISLPGGRKKIADMLRPVLYSCLQKHVQYQKLQHRNVNFFQLVVSWNRAAVFETAIFMPCATNREVDHGKNTGGGG